MDFYGAVSLLGTASFVPSAAFGKSKQLHFDKSGFNYQIEIKSSVQGDQQCYLAQPLHATNKYRIRMLYTQHKKANPVMQFGLLKEADKDSKWMFNSSGVVYSLWMNGSCTPNKIVKGAAQRNSDTTLQTKRFEIRIDIQNKLFKLGTIPGFENVIQLDQSAIDPNGKYYFGIFLSNQDDVINIEDIIEEVAFDNSM